MKLVGKILISSFIAVVAVVWLQANVFMKRPTSTELPVYQAEIKITPGKQELFLAVLDQFSNDHQFKLAVSTVTPRGDEYSIVLDREDIKIWISTAATVTVFGVFFYDGDDMPTSSETIASVSTSLKEIIQIESGFEYRED